MFDFAFVIGAVLLGVGLAMDAFSVSVANGIAAPAMPRSGRTKIAGCFAAFQFVMPMLGWFFVHSLVNFFSALQPFIPWIALGLLLYIGGKMVVEGMRDDGGNDAISEAGLGTGTLMVQGVATSIDALSVGFTISEYDIWAAMSCSLIVGAVTFVVCLAGVALGGRVGMRFANKAQILGGVILIGIGIEIWARGVFF